MKRGKGFLWVVVIVFLIVFLSYAYGKGDAEPKKEIVRWVQMDQRPQDVAGINGLKKAFELANPGIEITIEFLPWAGSVDQLTTWALAGQPPECSQSEVAWLGSFVAADLVDDITDKVKEYPFIYDYYTVPRDAAEIDGKWYGLPWFCGVPIIYYNRQHFSDAGLSDRDVPETWDELFVIKDKLSIDKNKDGIKDQYTWVWAGADDSGIYQLMRQARQRGAKVLDDQGQVMMKGDAWVRALKFFKRTVDTGVSPPDSLSINYSARDRAFAEGYASMYIHHNWVNHAAWRMRDEDGNLTVGASQIPYQKDIGPSSRNGEIGGSNLVIYSAAKNKEAAWKWISFMSSPDGQKIWIENTMFTPTSVTIGDSAFVQNNPFIMAAINSMAYTYTPEKIPGFDLFIYEDGRIIFQEFMGGKYSAEEAAKRMAERLTEMMKR
jgi:ABC-type glycerol-3-phosphate transport system substrate-binding protein